MLKLPRTTLSPEAIAKVEAFFSSSLRPVCKESETLISSLPLGPELRESLQITARTQCITQGLETITRELDDEKNGLVKVQQKTGQPAVSRMSRLLFISKDGSDRFYYQVAALLEDHGERVWCVRLDAHSNDLGPLIASRQGPAKAAMINDKKALASFLVALARHLK